MDVHISITLLFLDPIVTAAQPFSLLTVEERELRGNITTEGMVAEVWGLRFERTPAKSDLQRS